MFSSFGRGFSSFHLLCGHLVTALCADHGAFITCDVTDEGFPIIIFGKRVKPRMDPALVPDFEDRYLENEKRFFKNNVETVFSGPNSIMRNQLVETLQLTFKLGPSLGLL